MREECERIEITEDPPSPSGEGLKIRMTRAGPTTLSAPLRWLRNIGLSGAAPSSASSARRGMRGLPRAKSEGHEGGVRAGAGRNDHELPARFRFVRHGSGANWKRGRHARQLAASRLVESV